MTVSIPFEVCAATHVGLVRTRNEDSYITRMDIGLAAVSDGMGGHEAGDVASATVVQALGAIPPQPSPAELLRCCEEGLVAANRQIRDLAIHRNVRAIGATIVLLLTFDEFYACLWAGDSRAYLVRKGEISQITNDHTEVAALIEDGTLTIEEAKNWPRRNVITRAIGVSDQVEFELKNGRLSPGDVFILCSDGLTGHVEPHEIANLVNGRRPTESCRQLVDLALERGGRDNVTVVVLCYNPEGAGGHEQQTLVRPGSPPPTVGTNE
jgi:serine/threonine protein phosphatase PrpC